MAITAKVKVNRKDDKEILKEAISSLKKSVSVFKAERKTEWKSFKEQYKSALDNIEKSLKIMNNLHKK